eukprot:351599-Chlamydomonas_euryale.AAC.2
MHRKQVCASKEGGRREVGASRAASYVNDDLSRGLAGTEEKTGMFSFCPFPWVSACGERPWVDMRRVTCEV